MFPGHLFRFGMLFLRDKYRNQKFMWDKYSGLLQISVSGAYWYVICIQDGYFVIEYYLSRINI